jgi:isoleucyl-tRNA synthetase
VFDAGWVKLEQEWKKPELAASWATLRTIRTEVNKVMEQARAEKMIGASLDGKVLLSVADAQTRKQLEALNPQDSLSGDHVDELRYLFLASQVEVLDSPEAVQKAEYKSEADKLSVGVVKAEGEKCDRCWNYSTRVGTISEHPLLCDRCVPALADQF